MKPGVKLGQGCGGTSHKEGKGEGERGGKGGKISKLAPGHWCWQKRMLRPHLQKEGLFT